jgi:5-methylcytosine-specific restriction endonuclease McrA
METSEFFSEENMRLAADWRGKEETTEEVWERIDARAKSFWPVNPTRSNRGGILPSVKRDVLIRCKGLCESCGQKKPLDMHHLRYYDDDGKLIFQREKPEDLKAVCRSCHKRIHGVR